MPFENENWHDEHILSIFFEKKVGGGGGGGGAPPLHKCEILAALVPIIVVSIEGSDLHILLTPTATDNYIYFFNKEVVDGFYP